MADKSDNPFKFWEELKRRKVVRVLIAYAAAAFVLLELVDIIAEPLGLPDWTINFVLILLCVGFVIAVILSWVYDITPEGVQKTKPANLESKVIKQPSSIGWKISTYLSALIIVAFVMFNMIGNIKRSSDISKLEKSIAVLPFENFSYGEEYAHYGNAIANEITTDLSNIEGFHVVSYTSSSQYKSGNKPPIPQIGRELDVNFILEGSIERQGDKVNIHVQIIQANKDYHLSAREFDGMWEDIHSFQDDISLTVANELKTLLSPEEVEQIERRPTNNPEAYEYYLRGNEYLSYSFEEQDMIIANNMYQMAIDLDPDFAIAYTNLARANLNIYHFHYDRSFERIVRSKEAIDMAFTINPNLPQAYYALANYYYKGFIDYPKALEQVNLAIQYESNNTKYYSLVGSIYRRMGKTREALESYHHAFENNPRSNSLALAIAETYYLLNEYPEALEFFDFTLKLRPDYIEAYKYKINMFLKLEGNTLLARKTLAEASQIVNLTSHFPLVEIAVLLDIYEGNYQDALSLLNASNFEAFYSQFYYYPKYLYYAWTYDLMDNFERAEHYYNLSRQQIEEKLQTNPADSRYYGSLGICYAGLDQIEEAIDLGNKAVEMLPIEKEAWRGYFRLLELAQIYVMVGENRLALEQLDYLLSVPGDLSTKLIQLNPVWKPLWDLPEFKQLLEKYTEN